MAAGQFLSSLWAYRIFKPKVSLWFYVQEGHMLVKYLYLIFNPLKIKTLLLLLYLLLLLLLLQTAHEFSSSSILYYVIKWFY